MNQNIFLSLILFEILLSYFVKTDYIISIADNFIFTKKNTVIISDNSFNNTKNKHLTLTEIMIANQRYLGREIFLSQISTFAIKM